MKVFAVTLLCFQLVTCSKILALFPYVGKSHHDVYAPYLKKLAARGHDVTVVSHFPQEQPIYNITDISIKGSVPMASTHVLTFKEVDSATSVSNSIILSYIAEIHCTSILQLAKIHEVVNERFDLVITELFNTDCFLGLIHILRTPFIYFSSSVLMPWANDRFGNPDNPSYIPNVFQPHSDEMDFWERLLNAVSTIADKWIVYPLLVDLPGRLTAEKYLGIQIPPLADIAKRGSLILVNSHFSLTRARPLVPAVVEVGGIHIDKPAKKLPQVVRRN
jgi:glucuronosyltransferase